MIDPGEAQATVPGEIRRRGRHAVLCQIGGRGIQRPRIVRQPPRHQGILPQRRDPDGEVEPLSHDVDDAVAEQQVQLQAGMLLQEAGYQRCHDAATEGNRCCHPQHARHPGRAGTDRGACQRLLLQQRPGMRQKGLALRSQREGPRRAVHQSSAHRLLQRREAAGGEHWRDAEAACGGGEASRLHGLHQHGDARQINHIKKRYTG